jgi:hypothetical protein
MKSYTIFGSLDKTACKKTHAVLSKYNVSDLIEKLSQEPGSLKPSHIQMRHHEKIKKNDITV